MIPKNKREEILNKVKNMSTEELLQRFEEFGSHKLLPGKTFDLAKFLDEELARLGCVVIQEERV